MCCNTHLDRDESDTADGITFVLAESDDVRCMCKIGIPCMRRMTEEDLLCDWCRNRNHTKACGEQQERWRERVEGYRGMSPDEFRNQYVTEIGEPEQRARKWGFPG